DYYCQSNDNSLSVVLF
nr:immunoglobulin light chain junction region [Macaca mulatta]MOW58641.1 immunoglobulin light chain junction region [Macaca mulatta]